MSPSDRTRLKQLVSDRKRELVRQAMIAVGICLHCEEPIPPAVNAMQAAKDAERVYCSRPCAKKASDLRKPLALSA